MEKERLKKVDAQMPAENPDYDPFVSLERHAGKSH